MQQSPKHILILDSDETILIELERVLEDAGFRTTTTWNTLDVTKRLDQGEFDLLMVADHPPEVSCELILKQGRQKGSDIPLVVLSGNPRHPFAEPYLLNLGAHRVVDKQQPAKVREAVQEYFSLVQGTAAKSAVAGIGKLG
jgi:CheY-like chemotaxis protein